MNSTRSSRIEQQFVDLHCHSTASDGTLPPRDLVRLAKHVGLSGLALTDHDTVAGCADAADEAQKLGIDFLPGIEISCEYPRPGTMHLLGYGVDPHSPVLGELTRRLIDGRSARNVKIIQSLNDQGVAITLDEVRAQANGGTVGRPHFAAILERKGYVTSKQQAFDKYLGQTGSAYADKETVTPRRAIAMIDQSGGLAVLAHPFQLRKQNLAQLETEVKKLVDAGLMGIEIIHSDHDEEFTRALVRLAERFGLLQTGGSDFHGSNKAQIQLGQARGRKIPRHMMDAIIARLMCGD
jgi:predicted metal-dependent phosphoesterase TrpH